MKKHIVLLTMCILMMAQSYGQDWSVFGIANDTIHFTTANAIIVSARVDSIDLNGSERITFLHSELELRDSFPSQYCHAKLHGNSWLGNHISEQNKTISLFYGSHVFSWNLQDSVSTVQYSNSLISVVKTSKTEQTLFNGAVDSVITFTITTQMNNGLDSCLQGTELSISKHNGLLRFPSCFKAFVAHPGASTSGVFEIDLGQLTRTAYEIPKATALFDFVPGDEFHYQTVIDNVYTGISQRRERKIILSKGVNASAQSVTYTIFYEYNGSAGNMQDTITETYSDTSNKFLQRFTGEAFKENPGNGLQFARVIYNQNLVFSGLGVPAIEHFYAWKAWNNSPDSCLHQIWRNPSSGYPEDGFFVDRMVKGLGNVLNIKSAYQLEIKTTTLAYANTAMYGQFGTPLYPVSVAEYAINQAIVSPNPAKDIIRISGLENEVVSWQIIDVTGRTLLSQSDYHALDVIDIRVLPAGIYLLLINEQQAIRLIKEN